MACSYDVLNYPSVDTERMMDITGYHFWLLLKLCLGLVLATLSASLRCKHSRMLACMCTGDAWHLGHDARRHQAEQSTDDPSAPQWGLALLEGKHSVEGSWPADTDWEHDPALREGESWLVDKHGTLQPRANSAWSYRRQDCLQEEPRTFDSTLLEGRTRETAQLPQGLHSLL